jgi:hypothetical protein
MSAWDVGDRHKKSKRAKRKSHLLFAQQEFGLKPNRHEVVKHPFANPPKHQCDCDEQKISIQVFLTYVIAKRVIFPTKQSHGR